MAQVSWKSILFDVIRAGLGLPSSAPPISSEEFLQLRTFGKRQSILPIIWKGLQSYGIPSVWENEVKQDVLPYMVRYVRRENSINNICRSLDGSSIRYVLLKGAEIQFLYPEKWMRTSSDIDILVRREDLFSAVKAIEENTSFQTKEKGFHDVSMISENYHLELHFSLSEREEKIDPLLEKAWEYATFTGEGSRYTFTPEYNIFYVTAHMAHHFINGGLGIRPFIDLWLMTNRTAYDKETLDGILISCELKAFFDTCCDLISVWFDGADHNETTARLEKFCLSGGVLGSRELVNIARQRHNKGWKYVFSRIWIPKYELICLYGDTSEGKNHSTVYYQIKRWKSWFGKHKRKELKRQIGNLNDAKGEEISEFAKLCQETGLQR